MEINPFDTNSHNILGVCLALTSARYAEGIPSFHSALQLNPIDPFSFLFLTQLALAELGDEQFDTAVGHARDALRHHPDFFEAQIVLASSLGHLGRVDDAKSVIEEGPTTAHEYVDTHIVYSRDLKDRLIDGLRKAGFSE